MTSRSRVSLLLLTALVLPACGPRHGVQVTVVNRGFHSARVEVEAEQAVEEGSATFVQEAIVAPGSSVTLVFHDVLCVRTWVWVASESFLLFSGAWDEDDLRRLHDHITVTVSP